MRTTYILAVSGGVDSGVLLDKLMSVKPPTINYIVAHFDHGIRSDSSGDAAFVRELAKKYGVPFELGTAKLGQTASEELAREKRYEFLFEVKKRYKAEAIITAHHQDDVVETMIVNVLRGTRPRGMVGYTQKGVLRPFIKKTKKELIEYAKEHNLKWREDSTNADKSYLRNKIRLDLIPRLKRDDQAELLRLRQKVEELQQEIDDLSSKILVHVIHKRELVRSRFTVYPYLLQKQLFAHWLRLYGVEINQKMIEKGVLAAKVLMPNRTVELNKTTSLQINKKTIVLIIDGEHV